MPLLVNAQAGALDMSFSGDGIVTVDVGGNDVLQAITLDEDQNIYAAGYAVVGAGPYKDICVAKFTPDGVLDPVFGGDGIVTTDLGANFDDLAYAIAMQPDGKIVVAGSSCIGSCDFVLLRYNNTSGTSGINNSSTTSEFKIFPNPNNGQFSIQIERGGVFELMDITGKVLNTYTIKNTNHIINEKLSPGLYFIRETESHTATKIIIE